MAHLSSGPRDGALCALDKIVGCDCDVGDGRSCKDVGPLSSLEINHGGIGRGREGERQEDG
jgi:hypothetical protein